MTARSKTLPRIAAAIAAVVAIALAAGCGDSDDSASGSGGSTIATSSLSKDEFILAAGKACQRARNDILEQALAYLAKHEPKNATKAQSAAVFADMSRAVVLPTIRDEIAAIRAIGAPAGDEDEVEAFLASEEKGIRQVEGVKNVVSRFQLERYFTPAAALARDYGLGACSNGTFSTSG